MQSLIWILWDLAAIGILSCSVWICARRGLIRTLINFLAYVISAVLARALSMPLAVWLYDNIVRDILEASLTSRLESAIMDGMSLLEAAPSMLLELIESALGAEIVQSQLTQGTSQVVNLVIDEALRDPVTLLLQSFGFLVLFWLILAVVRQISRIFTGVYKIPVLGTVNTALGGVVGVFQGILLLLVCAIVIHMFLLVAANSLWWLNTQVMDDTFIWRFFLKIAGNIA